MVIEPKTRHFWLPSQRSLCDRRALPHGDESVEAYASAPICGACLLILHIMRTEMVYQLLDRDEVWPVDPQRAARALKGTTWDLLLDLEHVGKSTKKMGITWEGILSPVDRESFMEAIEKNRAKQESAE